MGYRVWAGAAWAPPAASSCSSVIRRPNAKRYQRRYAGSHFDILKLDTPNARSSQMVGISATGRRSRRALAVSSSPISKPARLSMPTSRTNVGRVRLEAVGGVPGADPGEPVQRPPGQPGQQALQPRAADLLAAGHVARRGRHHHAPLDQPGQVVDLARVVAAVGHGHHRHRRPGARRCRTGSRWPGPRP